MHDQASANRQMLEEVTEGLKRPQKSIPSKYFYDERGSELFERITELDEYYPTRTEIGILNNYMNEIAECVEPPSPQDEPPNGGTAILELGSGSSRKTRMLLDHLDRLAAYIPVDISRAYLESVGSSLKKEYPNLAIRPVTADYTRPFELPAVEEENNVKIAQWVVFYPGSTIGNFEPEEARQFLGSIAGLVGSGGGLLIGVDLKKDRDLLERAYNDAEGVTARFNKNILRRLNREIDADFDADRFEHDAFYNESEGRIEMHLVSQESQKVRLNGESIPIEKGESIHTENSYKYSLEEFEKLVEGIYRVEKVWMDENGLFSVQYLRVKRETGNGRRQT